jgi:hypothetical protein
MKLLKIIQEVKAEANMPHNLNDPSNTYTMKIIRMFSMLDKPTQVYVFKKIMGQLDNAELLEKDELFIQRENLRLRSFIFKSVVVVVLVLIFSVVLYGNVQTAFLTEIIKTINTAINVN